MAAALDELRFGPQRTLNLRETLPTAPQAVRRAEAWLRQHQVAGSAEVLIITGRGANSLDGLAVVRPAIEKLLFSLRRRGVVASHRDHNPGAFVVQLASLRALSDAAPRRRSSHSAPLPTPALHGLSSETMALLRDLAERSLDALGVSASESRVSDEMHRYLRLIGPGLGSGDAVEERLRAAIRAAIAEYD